MIFAVLLSILVCVLGSKIKITKNRVKANCTKESIIRGVIRAAGVIIIGSRCSVFSCSISTQTRYVLPRGLNIHRIGPFEARIPRRHCLFENNTERIGDTRARSWRGCTGCAARSRKPRSGFLSVRFRLRVF